MRVLLSLLIVAIAFGCASTLPLMDSKTRFFLDGYSILPPEGEGWIYNDKFSHSSQCCVWFEKSNIQDKTFNSTKWTISSHRITPKSHDISNAAGLKAEIDYAMIPHYGGWYMFRTSEIKFDEYHNTDCIITKYSGPIYSKVSMMFYFVEIGKACRDPVDPGSYVWITCTEYRKPKYFEELQSQLRQQCDRVINSLEFRRGK